MTAGVMVFHVSELRQQHPSFHSSHLTVRIPQLLSCHLSREMKSINMNGGMKKKTFSDAIADPVSN